MSLVRSTWILAALAGVLAAGAHAAQPPLLDSSARQSLTLQPQGGARSVAAQWRRLQQAPGRGAHAAPQGLAPWRGQVRPFQVRQGRRLVEGDIDIGAHRNDAIQPEGLGLAGSVALWPDVGGVAQIPYVVSQGNADVAVAIARFNTVFAGALQWVPRAAEADYVDISLDPNDHSGSGFSSLGRVGGRQVIGGSIDVNAGTLLHEMGHAIGLFHEHSRPEREAYLTLATTHVIGSLLPNLDVVRSEGQSLGLYDLASIMHYGPFTFSKDGEPTMESIPPGQPISELGDYSAGDIDAVLRLYQRTPGTVTVTSNPPGLQVLLDGVTVTTPHTFAPALDSTHTLDVVATPQTLGGKHYLYGRWNDNAQRAHTITIGRGNGATGSPVNKPAVSVYQASFVELLPHEPFVWPAGSGSVQATPAALAYPPLAGLYHVKRQAVQLQAVPQPGYSLYRLYTVDGGVSQNPKTTRASDWVLGYFTPQPVTTIATQPAGRWLWVDGGFWYGPVGFAADYDAGWTPGSNHLVDVSVSPQLPYSFSIRYPWQAWSDGGAQSHTITVPAASSTVTASFGQEFNLWSWAQQPCAGGVAAAPPSGDGFYAAGSSVTMTQTTVPGWVFTGWQRDLAGTQNPAPLLMNDEHIVVAGYNTAALPISISSLTPASRVAGQGGFTLNIAGEGFTTKTRAWVNGVYRKPKSATDTLLKVKMVAADAALPGTVALFVDNLPTGSWNCSAYATAELPVRSASAQPLATVAPGTLKFGKVSVGATSAPQLLTLTNPGTKILALHDTVVAGGPAGDFLVGASTCTSGLAPAASCTVELRFKPTALGDRASRVLVIDSALDSPQAVPVSGTGK